MNITAAPSEKKRAERFYLAFEGLCNGKAFWAYYAWNSRRGQNGSYQTIGSLTAAEKRAIGRYLKAIKNPGK